MLIEIKDLYKNWFERFIKIYNTKPFIAKKDIITFQYYIPTDIPLTVKNYFGGKYNIINTILSKVDLILVNSEDLYFEFDGYLSYKYPIEKFNKNSLLYKCIIPKGSKYYKGNDGNKFRSDQLIILNEIL